MIHHFDTSVTVNHLSKTVDKQDKMSIFPFFRHIMQKRGERILWTIVLEHDNNIDKGRSKMPVASKETLYHAIFLAQHLNKCDLQDGLVYVLLELQMPAHNIGYYYVKMAILLFYQDPVHSLLTGIYQMVGQTVDPSATYQQVDQAMRFVIKQAYNHCDPQIWEYYFQSAKSHSSKRPSNYEFIAQITSFLKLWQACCKEVSYEI